MSGILTNNSQHTTATNHLTFRTNFLNRASNFHSLKPQSLVSTNLYLDRSLAKGKRVLNLFSYTGAFTLAALQGGAQEVLSVDLSKNYLDWLRRNIQLNHFSLDQAPVHCREVSDYLKWAKKKSDRFDLIVLDPPTFSRGGKKNKSFSTHKNLSELIFDSASLLTQNGNLWVSINTQTLTPSQFQNLVQETLQSSGFQVLKTFTLPLDFRLSKGQKGTPHLKSCLVGATKSLPNL